ncbi:MAG: non-canonical purine NTP pyrophosphatase [Gemmatimonadaceae bacterium]
MSRNDIILATRSADKLRELRPLFESAGFIVADAGEFGLAREPDDDELESHDTFRANALAKAHHFYDISGGVAAVADDSGLEVAALGGRPGVRSKRFSGRTGLKGRALDAANNRALVTELEGVADRSARYVCAAAFVGLDHEIVAEGETAGEMLTEPRGQAGFGYDSLFLSADLGVTFGECTPQEKMRVSHRGRAFRELIAALRRGVVRG